MNRKPFTSGLLIAILVAGGIAAVSQAQPLKLQGRVYEGTTGTEPPVSKPLANVPVALYGAQDQGPVGTLLASTTTDASAYYELVVPEDPVYEFYNIVQTNLPGYNDSNPPGATSVGGTVINANRIQYTYPLDIKDRTGNKFWDKAAEELCTITVYKWEDKNGNCAMDQGEPGLQGWEIFLDDNQNGTHDAGETSKTTDSAGYCYFDVPCHATYYVAEKLKPGWQATCAWGSGPTSINVTIPDVAHLVIFGNRQTAGDTCTINVYKWEDKNGDCVWDQDEQGLANWKIFLDNNQNGTHDAGEPHKMTDGTGWCWFDVDCHATYYVSEELKPGWQATCPWGSGPTSINVTIPDVVHLVRFGNRQVAGEYDFGDAPDSYGTLKASGGASHLAYTLRLGQAVDTETDGHPSADALGDDNAGTDDEDGVVSLSDLSLVAGQTETIDVMVSNAANFSEDVYVAGWIDLNGNNQFDMVGDDIGTHNMTVPAGGQKTVQFSFNVPTTAPAKTYARFRLYWVDPDPTAPPWVIVPIGEADKGEVEDYEVEILTEEPDRDFGDAPTGYPSASHALGGPWFGDPTDLPDQDPGMQHHPAAMGDDNDGNDDEDGGTVWGDLVKGNWGVLSVDICVGGSGDATVAGWIDFNGNGSWDDAGEALGPSNVSLGPPPPGGWHLPTVWAFPIPANAQIGPTFARLRIYEGTNAPVSSKGPAGAGEVEDHLVEIKPDGQIVPPGPVIAGKKFHDLNGDGLWDWFTEPSLPDWKIYLDINKNGAWDPGEPYQITDSNGDFVFTGLAAGTYVVAEELQPGWIQTHPAPPGTHTVNAQPSMFTFGILFGNQALDWGDAPDPTYPTLGANNGAHHAILPGLFLGGGVDPETDGQPNGDATGDDVHDVDDEDGIYFPTPIEPGQMAGLEIVASAAGFIDAWIDFGDDGSWGEPMDRILNAEPVVPGSNLLSVAIPAAAKWDVWTFARFRFGLEPNLPPIGYGGPGEVEDYRVCIGECEPNGPPEELPHIKWSQPPIEIDPNPDVDSLPVFCGWDEPTLPQSPTQWKMVADDFHCLGAIPITRIRWWGSYEDWQAVAPPAVQPAWWLINFWTNMPEDVVTDYSFPEMLIWQVEVPAERVMVRHVGMDEFPGRPSDACFEYFVQLESHEWFWQREFETRDDIFWISITPIYADDPAHLWGWKTRPEPWMDYAVRFSLQDEALAPGLVLDPNKNDTMPIECEDFCDRNQDPDLIELQGFDMSFELLTEEPWVKWDLPFTGLREWPHYEDEESLAVEDPQGHLDIRRRVADDWLCERPDPVIAVAWHGSYLGYGYEACKCPEPVPPEPRRPDYFLLNIWSDAPPNAQVPFDHPGNKVWEYEAYEYDEVLVGFDKHPEGEPNEPVFRYSVRLPKGSWFWQEDLEQKYWFSVVAVYKVPANVVTYRWGWTNHRHMFDGSAVAEPADTQGAAWQQLRDQADEPVDMSFMLFTCHDILDFHDFAWFAESWRVDNLDVDLDHDGDVDFSDVGVFAEFWLECYPHDWPFR